MSIFWKQKARIKWLSDGDKNTKIYHAAVAVKRSKLTINRIKPVDGEWIEDCDQIKQEAVSFFQNLLGPANLPTAPSAMAYFSDYIPTLVTEEHNVALLAPVQLHEIKEAIQLLDEDSAPGPDGFSGLFYRSCWDIISSDLLQAVQEFFAGVPIPRSIASALMVLLPKSESPSTFADRRPCVIL